MTVVWKNVETLASESYTCGYCGKPLASEKGYQATNPNGSYYGAIFVCHFCGQPTYFPPGGGQVPGVPFGSAVEGINDEGVARLYAEARNATSANAFTAAVMCCRKLLMHIAVDKNADQGESFEYYVGYLADHHYVPPDATNWVDRIRTKGNEANHEIRIMKQTDAADLLSFCEMLLKLIYEFPARVSEPPAETAETSE